LEETMGEPTEPSDVAGHSDLEHRRNRGTFYGESAARAAEAVDQQQPSDRAAIYMVERAAIQLRRLRWEPSSDEDQAARSAGIDALASRLAGTWPVDPHRVPAPMSDELLAQYARPRERPEEKAPSVTARIRRWFGGGGEKDQSTNRGARS
jgi:hypothetical protein